MLLAFYLTGCNEGRIRVGFVGALTGDQAVWGQADRDGLMLTIDQINIQGGILDKKVDLVVYDDKGDPAEAARAVERLIKQDKVVAIIGTNSSNRNIAMAPVAESGRVPVISTFATNPRVTVSDDGRLNRYTFRVCFTDTYSGEVKANYAYHYLNSRRAAILYESTSAYSAGVRDVFISNFEALGGEVVADEAFKSGDTDFSTQLGRIKEAHPDVLVMPFLYKEVALAAKQARQMGIEATFLGGDGWASRSLLEIAGPYVEGAYFVNHGDIEAPNVQEFRKQFKAKFGRDIEINSIMAHDAMIMLKAAIEKAGKAEPQAIREALENLKGVQVYTGTITINPQTHNPVGKAAVIIKIENNRFVFDRQFEATR